MSNIIPNQGSWNDLADDEKEINFPKVANEKLNSLMQSLKNAEIGNKSPEINLIEPSSFGSDISSLASSAAKAKGAHLEKLEIPSHSEPLKQRYLFIYINKNI